MQLVFCFYKYFPFGGLQRDFLRIALACQARGHGVRVYTLSWQGDVPAGFEVVHFPGHAPGLIGLWRDSDGVAIVSDTIYVVDSARLKELPEGEASVPHPAFAWDHQMAKESVRKLAALKPKVVMSGHGEPLRGEDLGPALEAAAEKY